MLIEKVNVGCLQENCYVVTNNGKSLIIDPGDQIEKILKLCDGKQIVEVLVTHHHFDHIGALKEIENIYKIKENEKSGFFDYEVIPTPGHTSDSISFYFPKEKVLFSGDFLFAGTIGRTDLPTGNNEEMKKSLDLISRYPDDLEVYPGHGEKTILGIEKSRFNYYQL